MNFQYRGVFKFQPAFPEPPTMISGTSTLDTQTRKPFLADMRHINVTREQATCITRAIGEGQFKQHLRWMAIPKMDKHYETGIYEFFGDEAKCNTPTWVGKVTYIPFSKPFSSVPVIVTWLCDIESGADHYSASTEAVDFAKEGFNLRYMAGQGSGPQNRSFAGRRAGWFAYDPNETPNIQSGELKGTVLERDKRETFGIPSPKPPAVFAAIRYVEGAFCF